MSRTGHAAATCFAVGLLLVGRIVHADTIVPGLKTEINLLTQSIIVDTDLYMLGIQFPNVELAEPFRYVSVTDDEGWEGILTGSINGEALRVVYSGSLIGDPEPSWQSRGRLGDHNWNGRGNGNISIGPPTINGIPVQYNPLTQELSVGTVLSSGIITWSVAARKDLDDRIFVIDTAVGAGFAGVNLVELAAAFRLDQSDLRYQSTISGRFLIFSRTHIVNDGSFSSTTIPPVTNTMTVTPVPEPSSIVLIGSGCVTLAGLRGLRRHRKKHIELQSGVASSSDPSTEEGESMSVHFSASTYK